MSGTPAAVGAYIFAGGFTVGVKDHFNVVAHLEEGEFGVKTAEANHPEIPIYTEREDWPYAALRKMGVGFLYANPPCAPWSIANAGNFTREGGHKENWASWKDDPRVEMFWNVSKAAMEIQPTVWAIESVQRTFQVGQEMVMEMADLAQEMGYAVTHVLVDAMNFGLAQRRRRYFFVAHRVELEWPDSPPIWRPSMEVISQVKAPGIGAKVSDKVLAILPQAKEGKPVANLFHEVYAEGVKGCPNFSMRRERAWAPAGTITGYADHIHPTEDRLLTPLEHAALCGYPADYQWVGNVTSLYEQIAKAVLPPAGRWLAGVVRRGIDMGISVEPQANNVDYLTAAERMYRARLKEGAPK